MKNADITRFVSTIATSTVISVVSGMALVLTIVIATCSGSHNLLIILTLPTIISLGIIPFLLARLMGMKHQNQTFGKKLDYIIFLTVIIFGNLLIRFNTSISEVDLLHLLIAAFCEELLYRWIIYNDLQVVSGTIVAILVNSLLFAFIGHINDDILDNLVFRLPIGFVLSVIRWKSGSILYSTLGHSVYNILLII